MSPSRFLSLAFALQAATNVVAIPSRPLFDTDAFQPGEPPVFESRPLDPGNGTNITEPTPSVASARFEYFSNAQYGESAAAIAEGLTRLEVTYDCFVGSLGWNSTGLWIRDGQTGTSYYKTEIYAVADVGGGFAGLARYGERTWIQLNAGIISDPEVPVHEFGHALHWHQGNKPWPSMANARAWSEALANWIADMYLTSDMCAASRERYGLSTGYTIFRPYATVDGSHLAIIDASNSRTGNYYNAWPFFHYLVANPDGWRGGGRDVVLTLIRATPAGTDDETPLHVLQRVLGDTATVAEVVARYWARMAYVDIEHEQALRVFFDNKPYLNQQNFEVVAEDQYRVKPDRAPRYMGASMAPLVTSGPSTVEVEVTTAEEGAVLTVSLAVRDKTSGRVRYVALADGSGSVDVAEGEEATLVVVNAPEELLKYDPYQMEGSEANIGIHYSFTLNGATVSMY
jgi:hypothetical protein